MNTLCSRFEGRHIQSMEKKKLSIVLEKVSREMIGSVRFCFFFHHRHHHRLKFSFVFFFFLFRMAFPFKHFCCFAWLTWKLKYTPANANYTKRRELMLSFVRSVKSTSKESFFVVVVIICFVFVMKFNMNDSEEMLYYVLISSMYLRLLPVSSSFLVNMSWFSWFN